MSQGIAWTLLVLAGLLDVAWALSMKLAEGYTRASWTIVSVALLASFVFLLGRVLEVLPVGTAYAVWTGIGAAGTVIAGTLLFGEEIGALKSCGILLVIAGIVALKWAEG
ncbi:MAG TPA: multidrug efflux SMR transporter [Xanthobacteraceae bacterium]|nr:multidrug efflux SMR transporter [Xanthobacteraceae bacterium]